MQRPARGIRVVLGARRQRPVLGDPRQQRLKRPRTTSESDATGLVGKRERHRRIHHTSKCLDRIELQAREVVEAVEMHGRASPQARRVPQRIQRGSYALGWVCAPQALEQLVVAREQIAQFACAPLIPSRLPGGAVSPIRALCSSPWLAALLDGDPSRQRLAQPCGRDPLHLQLLHERRQRSYEAGPSSQLG